MSFYSSLNLIVNEVDQVPSKLDIRRLLLDCGIIDPTESEFCYLADDIAALFIDPLAEKENDRFFCPDSVGFRAGIDLQASGEVEQTWYEGTGWSISIHGNGYFYPWTLDDYRTRVLNTPKLKRLREEANARYGGRFRIPASHATLFKKRLIVDDGGWAWVGSESF